MTEHPDRSTDRDSGPRHRSKGSDIGRVLPPVAELISSQGHSMLRYTDLEGAVRTIDYRDLADQDPLPIPLPIDREGYSALEHSAHYWATGYADWSNVQQAIDRLIGPEQRGQRPLRVLDFGCATGRVLRHVPTFGGDQFEAWGCDYAESNVRWANKHLPALRVVLNAEQPPLPFPDGHFDVVTAFSVFTHIDAQQFEWLQELQRITSRHGMLYLTIQNEASWSQVASRPGALEHMLHANKVPGNIEINERTFDQPMPQDRIVLKMSKADVYNCTVWLSSDYITKNWSQYFEVVDIVDCAHGMYQSVVLLRNTKK